MHLFEVPDDVLDVLRELLRRGGNAAHRGWSQYSADEDSLTGHLGAVLSGVAHGGLLYSSATVGDFRFSVTPSKVRGRGKNAPEKKYGIDGILVVEVIDSRTGKRTTKGLVFQSKKIGNRSGLDNQVRKMEDRLPGLGSVFEYGPNAYRAADAHDVDSGDPAYTPLGDYLAEKFMRCTVGRVGVDYDTNQRTLMIEGDDGTKERIQLDIPLKLTLSLRLR